MTPPPRESLPVEVQDALGRVWKHLSLSNDDAVIHDYTVLQDAVLAAIRSAREDAGFQGYERERDLFEAWSLASLLGSARRSDLWSGWYERALLARPASPASSPTPTSYGDPVRCYECGSTDPNQGTFGCPSAFHLKSRASPASSPSALEPSSSRGGTPLMENREAPSVESAQAGVSFGGHTEPSSDGGSSLNASSPSAGPRVAKVGDRVKVRPHAIGEAHRYVGQFVVVEEVFPDGDGQVHVRGGVLLTRDEYEIDAPTPSRPAGEGAP